MYIYMYARQRSTYKLHIFVKHDTQTYALLTLLGILSFKQSVHIPENQLRSGYLFNAHHSRCGFIRNATDMSEGPASPQGKNFRTSYDSLVFRGEEEEKSVGCLESLLKAENIGM